MFFIFNLQEINSNIDKKILYNLNNVHEENYFKIYLKNINSFKLNEIINKLDIDIISYGINEKVYYSKDINNLINDYTKNLSIENKIYYTINGINIDYITTRCETEKIIELEKMNIIF